MDSSDRRSERRAPRNLEQFAVSMEDNIHGYLENISQHGLCVVLPIDQPALQRGQKVSGRVLGRGIKVDLPFSGNTVWFSIRKIDQTPYVYAGIEFESPMEIPESLISHSLARESGD
ncbi:MAG: PilZ domain-containing protein [Leptospiraceae bacterium]|nr:PilZ domain-containing protein [Leptospiraceae bacterium]